MFHPAATCRARIADNIDLTLVEEFKAVSALTRKPVKVTMTGPHMLAKVAYDEHYNDIGRMMADLAKLLRFNFKKVVEAGCRHIQIDEPLFTMSDDAEVANAVDAINLAIADLPDDVHVSVHICQGNYAVGKEYDAQIGHRYFDTGRYKADLVTRIACSSYLIEYDMAHHYEGLLRDRQLGVGAVDVQDPKVETGEIVAKRIRDCAWLAPEQTIITSSCGFNHLPRDVAYRQTPGDERSQTHPRRLSDDGAAIHSAESAELLLLAEQVGRIGVLEWQVQNGTMRLSAKALEIYGLEAFDGRYESWLATIYREDVIRLRNVIANALAKRGARIRAGFPHRPAERQGFALDPGAPDCLLRRGWRRRCASSASAPISRTASVSWSSCAISPRRSRRPSRSARGHWRPRTRRAARRRIRCAMRRSWRRSVSSPAASRTTSTISSLSCSAASTWRRGGSPTCRPRRRRRASARGLDMAVQGARRAATLTSRLLAFSRQQALAPVVDRRQQAGRRNLRISPHARWARRSRWRRCWPAACGAPSRTPTNWRMHCSIWRSMRATQCRPAASSRSRPRTTFSTEPMWTRLRSRWSRASTS